MDTYAVTVDGLVVDEFFVEVRTSKNTRRVEPLARRRAFELSEEQPTACVTVVDPGGRPLVSWRNGQPVGTPSAAARR